MGDVGDGRGALETLRVERDENGVVTVTLDRPEKKNAINGRMWDELTTVFGEVARNKDDRVLVLTGAGDAFCAGADLTEPVDGATIDTLGPGHALGRMRHVGEIVVALHRMPKPTLALVHGAAVGAGAGFALGCDLVLASRQARLSIIFAQRGLSLDGGTSWLLPRLVGLHRAKELALFGEVLDADTAHGMGLFNRVLADRDTLLETGRAWAARLAAGPPVQLATTKALLNDALGRTMSQAVDAEAMGQTVSLGTRDLREAIAAFVAKRPPRFSGD